MSNWYLDVGDSVDLIGAFHANGSAYLFLERDNDFQKGDCVFLYFGKEECKYAFKTTVLAVCDDFKSIRYSDAIFTKFLRDKSILQNPDGFRLVKVQLRSAALNSIFLDAHKENRPVEPIFEPEKSGVSLIELFYLRLSAYDASFDEMLRIYKDRRSIGLYLLKRCHDKAFCDELHRQAIRILAPDNAMPSSDRDILILKASAAMIAINYYQGGLWDKIEERYYGLIREANMVGRNMLGLRSGWQDCLRNIFKNDIAYSAGADYVSVPIIMAIVQNYFCQDFLNFVFKAIYKNRLSVTYEIEDQEMIENAVDSFLDSLTGEEDGEEAAQGNLLLYRGNQQNRFKVSKYTIYVLQRGLYRADVKELIVSLINKMIDHRYYGDMRTPALCPVLEEAFQKWIDTAAQARTYDPDVVRKEERDPERVAYIKKPRLFFRDNKVYVRIPSNDFPSDIPQDSIEIKIFDSNNVLVETLGSEDLEIFDLIGGKGDKRRYRVNCRKNVCIPNFLGGYSYQYYGTDSCHFESRKYLFFDEHGFEIQPFRDYAGYCFAVTSVPISGVEKVSEEYDQISGAYITYLLIGPKTAFNIGKDLIYFNSSARLGIGCEAYPRVRGKTANENDIKIYKEVSSLSFESEKNSVELDLHLDGSTYPVRELLVSENPSGKVGIYRYFIELRDTLSPGLHKVWISDKRGILVHSYGLEDRLFAIDPTLVVDSNPNSADVSIEGTMFSPQIIHFDLDEEEAIVGSEDGLFSLVLPNPLARYRLCEEFDKEPIRKLPGATEDACQMANYTFMDILYSGEGMSATLMDANAIAVRKINITDCENGLYRIYLPEIIQFIQSFPVSDLTIESAGKRIGSIRFFSVPYFLEGDIRFDLVAGDDPNRPDKRSLAIEGKYRGSGNLSLAIYESGSSTPCYKEMIEAKGNLFGLSIKGIVANKAWRVQLIGESAPDPFAIVAERRAVIIEKPIFWSSFKYLTVDRIYPIASVAWENPAEKSRGSYEYIEANKKHLVRASLKIVSKPQGGVCEAIVYDSRFEPCQNIGKVKVQVINDEHDGVCSAKVTRLDGGPVFATNAGLLNATTSVKNQCVIKMVLLMKGNTREKWIMGERHNVQ